MQRFLVGRQDTSHSGDYPNSGIFPQRALQHGGPGVISDL
jgi:hypothetical protein